MEGGGAYNRSSRVQATGLLPAVAMLEAAARHAALEPSPRTIVIADYGASQGHNSLLPMSAAIAALRARVGVDRAILVVHTDQPDNDFGALFRTLSDDPDSYLRNDAAAFASAVGRSFYGQILPPDSVTLGWSSWSVQWLSRLPGPIPDQVQVAYSHDPAARAAYARQAAEDWHTFLTARSSELCPGGRLVVQTMALDDAGEFGYRPLLAAMYAELEKMVADRFLRPEELGRMAIPTVGRSRADLAAPFGPARRFGSLSLESLDIFGGEDQVWARFERTGDAVAFGREWAAFSRASVFPTLATALDGGREDPRHPAFPNRLEAGVAARLAADPCPMTIPLAKMMLVKDLAP
jgi:hypothetical protein